MVEIIGILPHRFYSEVFADPVTTFDIDFIRKCAQAHESAGFDRVLIANSATYPDSIPLATWVTGQTERLKVMIAHRPGFVAPTMAARMFATMDQLAPGRVGVHIITGSNDVEMRADGDYLTKDQRYARSREYVSVMKRMWSAEQPFDYHDEFYRFEQAFATIKPKQAIPVFWGGGSPTAIACGSQVADVFAVAGGGEADVLRTVDAVRSAAAEYGRSTEFLWSSRVIIEDTEEKAWATARDHLRSLVREALSSGRLPFDATESEDIAVERLTAQYSENSRDGLVFSAFAKVGIGRPIANCLVGTVDQIVTQLARLGHAGISRFILAGYDPRQYPEQFGRILLPPLRAALALQEESARVSSSAVDNSEGSKVEVA